MPPETPRTAGGLATPRALLEVLAEAPREVRCDPADEALSSDDDDEKSYGTSSEGENAIDEDSARIKVVSTLIDLCSDCNRCKKDMLKQLSTLEAKFAEESMIRHRQLQFIVEYEKKTRDWFSEKNALIKKLQTEKNGAIMGQIALAKSTEDLESSFNEINRKYEKAQATIKILSSNVETLKGSLMKHEDCINQKQRQFEQLKEHAMEKLSQANAQLELAERNFFVECSKLRAAVNDAEAKVHELAKQLEQKNRENEELMSICDFLLQCFKGPRNYSLDELIHASVTMWLKDIRNNNKQY